MTTETWKRIDGFERYAVSSLGRVKRCATGRILHQCNSAGYKTVMLFFDGKTKKRRSVHRLVAEAFLDNPDCLPEVNHKDGNKSNNCADNLEWCTRSENQQHRRSVLKKGLRPVKCVETGTVYESVKLAATINNSFIPNIVRACQKGSTAVGLHWQYVERK